MLGHTIPSAALIFMPIEVVQALTLAYNFKPRLK